MLNVLFVGRRPNLSLFMPISMKSEGHRPLNKPVGGLWTCPDNERGSSAWREWNRSERCDFTRGLRTWRLTAEEPRVYTIDTLADLKRALRVWPHERYPDIPSLRGEYEIDFEGMASEYDAVYLTEDGQWRTRLSWPENLYGWDVPTILWLRWMFTGVEIVRRQRVA